MEDVLLTELLGVAEELGDAVLETEVLGVPLPVAPSVFVPVLVSDEVGVTEVLGVAEFVKLGLEVGVPVAEKEPEAVVDSD